MIRRVVSWFQKERENKKFRIFISVAVLLIAVLCTEFCMFEYSIFKSLRYVVLLAALFIISWKSPEISTLAGVIMKM